MRDNELYMCCPGFGCLSGEKGVLNIGMEMGNYTLHTHTHEPTLFI